MAERLTTKVCEDPQSRPLYTKRGTITHPKGCHVSPTFVRWLKLMLAHQTRKCIWAMLQGWIPRWRNWPQAFSLSTISRILFNSLSKVLFIFPSRYCLLSVSRQCLALDGIHHPFLSCISATTWLCWECITEHWWSVSKTGFSPLWAPHSRGLVHVQCRKCFSRLQLDDWRPPDFKFELFPASLTSY